MKNYNMNNLYYYNEQNKNWIINTLYVQSQYME